MNQSKRGRPKKSTADRLSTMVWAEAVKIQSKGMTPYKLEVTFMPEECVPKRDCRVVRPSLMDRYAKGELSPKNFDSRCGGTKLVERIDSTFAGTAKWLYLPLWELMQPKAYSLEEMHQIMAGIEGGFYYKFFSRYDWPERVYVRNFEVDIKEIRKVSRHNTLDAFAFLLGLVREAEYTLDVRVHFNACIGMSELFPSVARMPEIKPVAGQLFDYLEGAYFRVIYTVPDGSEIVFRQSWRELYPDLADQYSVSAELASDEDRRRLLQPIRRNRNN